MRSKYFILAPDANTAQAAMTRSGIDPFLAQNLRQTELAGSVRIFEVDLDGRVLERYRAAVASTTSSSSSRAQAYAGLGFGALREGKVEEAIRYLENGNRLAPSDTKIRYLLGWVYYLSFDDEKAEKELQWCVVHDTSNIHAPLYYGDTLAGRNRLAGLLAPIRSTRITGRTVTTG